MLLPPETQENDIAKTAQKETDLKKLLDPNIRARFSARINEQIMNTKNEKC